MSAEGTPQSSNPREALWKRKEELESKLKKIEFDKNVTTDKGFIERQLRGDQTAYEAELAQINEQLETLG